jgi:hypothetical protein
MPARREAGVVRYEFVLSVDDQGRSEEVGWTVRGPDAELVALGVHRFANVTTFGRLEALAVGIINADRDVARNGGIQAELPF